MRLILLFLFSCTVAKKLDPAFKKRYGTLFPQMDEVRTASIDDPILKDSGDKNTKLYIIRSRGKTVGFVRELDTTTGCAKYCKPLVFSLVFDARGKFLQLVRLENLTKKYHEEFNEGDYLKLDSLLRSTNSPLNSLRHSTEVADAITLETKKLYAPYVVKDAAFSSVRILQYVTHTRTKLGHLISGP